MALKSDSQTYFFEGRGTEKELVLELDDGEEVLSSIRMGMLHNHIHRATVKGIDGKIKEGMVNYFVGSSYKSREVKNTAIENAHGKYELRGRNRDELWGNLHVTISQNGKRETATLGKGIATNGLRVRLSFVHVDEK
jgi:predicted DNA-binding protein with PD1-like motif